MLFGFLKKKHIRTLHNIGEKMQVEEYLQKQKSPQKEICQQLREIILGAFPSIKEKMKWGVPTYGDGIFYFVALKDHVNLGFSVANLSKEEQQRFEGSGKTMKVIMINSMDEINKQQIIDLLKLVLEKQNAKTDS
jgi:uncharacterized protein YdhG (YjbR/CyaY superfamily)